MGQTPSHCGLLVPGHPAAPPLTVFDLSTPWQPPNLGSHILDALADATHTTLADLNLGHLWTALASPWVLSWSLYFVLCFLTTVGRGMAEERGEAVAAGMGWV